MKELEKIFGDVGIELIVSGVTLFFAFVWTKGIYPIIENLLYDGVRINGNWSVLQINPSALGIDLAINRDVIIKLKQKANKLKGEATSTHTKADLTKNILSYTVSGEIKDRFVTLFFKNVDKNKIAHSAFLIEVVADDKMKGFRVFYGKLNQEIDSIACTLIKAN